MNDEVEIDELLQAVRLNVDVANFLNLTDREKIEAFYREVDTDEDGQITWEEFRAYYIRNQSRKLQQTPRTPSQPKPDHAPAPPSSSPPTLRSLNKDTLKDTGSSLFLSDVVP